MTPLKVLLIAPQPFYSARGTPIAVRMLAEALGAAGHQVDLLTLPHGEDVDLPGVRILRVSALPGVTSVPIGPSFRKAGYDVKLLSRAARLLRSREYDVIHGVEDGALIAWVLSRTRVATPYIYDMDSHMSSQVHERGRLYGGLAGVFHAVEGRALRGAVGVLAVCPALVEVAREHQVIGQVALLPDTPLQSGDEVVPDPEVEALGALRVLYVGNLEKYQGIELLIQGFPDVVAAHPEARLIVVGGRPENIRRYLHRTEELGIGDSVIFLGPRPLERLGPILAAADILVSPRLKGVNTPMKIYSYLESGRPVVATRLRTHTQVLTDDVACLVPADAAGVSRGILRLAADPELRDAMGSRARRYVRAEFGPQRFRQRLLDFYEEVAARIVPRERNSGTGSAAGRTET